MIRFEPARITTIRETIEPYLEHGLSLGLLSKATARARRFELTRFAVFCETKGITVPVKMHKNLVVSYIGSLNVSNGTKYTIFAVLSAYLTYLVDEGLVFENFLSNMKRPKAYRPEADFLTEEELGLFFRSVAENSRECQADRNLLLVSLLAVLCLRISEAINLKIEDIDLRAPCLWVTRKGGKVERIPLNAELAQRFESWLELRKSWKGSELPRVFLSNRGKEMGVRQAQKMITGFLGKAGIVKRQNSAHLIRHSGASAYLKNGTDIKTVQTLLGHSNLSTTSRYVHSTTQALENAVGRFPKMTGKDGSSKNQGSHAASR